jgi:hypothetical protein
MAIHVQPDARILAIEHAHDHDHPEVSHPDGPLHHEDWGDDHAHSHRWEPTEDHHHDPTRQRRPNPDDGPAVHHPNAAYGECHHADCP